MSERTERTGKWAGKWGYSSLDWQRVDPGSSADARYQARLSDRHYEIVRDGGLWYAIEFRDDRDMRAKTLARPCATLRAAKVVVSRHLRAHPEPEPWFAGVEDPSLGGPGEQ